MLHRVKLLVSAAVQRLSQSPLAVSLLDTSAADQPMVRLAGIDLLSADAAEPPEWVRLLAPGVNKARDGRAYTVVDPAKVVQLSQEWKGAIALVVDFAHQPDRAATNGRRADACAWIKELSAKGPDGSPGVWARFDWLDETRALIKARKYRYLSAAVAHDAANNVLFVPRASLTNTPALDTTTALFSTDRNKEIDVNLLQKLLAAFGLADTTTEDLALEHAGKLATLAAAVAKQLGIEVSVLSAMTAEALTTALTKPLAEKIATLSATAKVAADATPDAIVAGIRSLGVDPAAYVPMSVHQEVSNRLSTLNAQRREAVIDGGRKAGKLTPAMIESDWMKGQTADQIVAYLSTAAVVVQGGEQQRAAPTIATLSADEKAAAKSAGVTEEAFLAAKVVETEILSRRAAQLG